MASDDEKSLYTVETLNGDVVTTVEAVDGEDAKKQVALQTEYALDDLSLPTEEKAEYVYGITD